MKLRYYSHKQIWLVLTALVLIATPDRWALARGQKKVIILDFKNITHSPGYNYLEASITSAVREDLKKRFEFDELPKEEWQSRAEETLFLWPDEHYTRSFALGIGMHTGQDIVIGGYYQVDTKKGTATRVIKTTVFLLDVGQKKVISNVVIELPTDSTLFAQISDLANRVADEAKAVLPNKGQGPAVSSAPKARLSPYGFGILAGTSVAGVPGSFSGNFTSKKGLVTKDFTPIAVSAYGDVRGLFHPNLRLGATLGLQIGSREMSVAEDDRTFTSTLTDISMAAHGGYEVQYKMFQFVPMAGLGFSLSNVTLDYSNLSALPLNDSGSEIEIDTLNTNAPFVELLVRMEWQVQPNLAVTLVPHYRQSFYNGDSVGQVLVLGGIGYRL